MRILASPGLSTRSMNPYCFLLYSNMRAEVVEYSWRAALRGRYDIYHLHWPETELNTLGPVKAFLQLKKKLLILDYLRWRGTRVVWTVHNLKSHERRFPRLERWFARNFTRRLDGFFVLSRSAIGPAIANFPHLDGLPVFVTPHGHYRGEYEASLSREGARRALDVPSNAKVLLAFGQIRAYKNLDLTIAAFRELSDPELVLLIAGQCRDEALKLRLLELAGDDPRIRFFPHHVPSDDVQKYMNASDLVVLPYRDILNSGSALLALSFNRPVLVPERGAMKELKEAAGENWVRVFSGQFTSAVLDEAVRWACNVTRQPIAPLEPFEWSTIANQSLRAFSELTATPQSAEAPSHPG